MLVVVEVALAAMLLILASLLIQTFVRLLNVNTGFQSDGVLTMEVALPRTVYPGQRPAEFFERLVTRLSAVPGVDNGRGDVERAAGGDREPAPGHGRGPSPP